MAVASAVRTCMSGAQFWAYAASSISRSECRTRFSTFRFFHVRFATGSPAAGTAPVAVAVAVDARVPFFFTARRLLSNHREICSEVSSGPRTLRSGRSPPHSHGLHWDFSAYFSSNALVCCADKRVFSRRPVSSEMTMDFFLVVLATFATGSGSPSSSVSTLALRFFPGRCPTSGCSCARMAGRWMKSAKSCAASSESFAALYGPGLKSGVCAVRLM